MVSEYLDGLRRVPQFRHLTDRDLREIGRLAESVDLPPGATIRATGTQDAALTYASARVLIIDRRALPRVLELAPDLISSLDFGETNSATKPDAPPTRTDLPLDAPGRRIALANLDKVDDGESAG